MPHRSSPRRLAPYAVLGLTALTALAVGTTAARLRHEATEVRLRAHAQSVAQRFELRMAAIAEALDGLGTTLSPAVEAPSRPLDALRDRFPEVVEVAWVRAVPAAERSRLERAARQAGLGGFCIRQPEGPCIDPGEPALAAAALSPLDTTRLGVDRSDDLALVRALERARDEGRLVGLPTESDLDQSGQARTAAVWLVPVQRAHRLDDVPLGRRLGLLGVLVARIDVDRALAWATAGEAGWSFAVLESERDRLVAGSPRVGSARWTFALPLDVPGERWRGRAGSPSRPGGLGLGLLAGFLTAAPGLLAALLLSDRERMLARAALHLEAKLAELAAHGHDMRRLLEVTAAEPAAPPQSDSVAAATLLVADLVEGRRPPDRALREALRTAARAFDAEGQTELAVACRETVELAAGDATLDVSERLAIAERWRALLAEDNLPALPRPEADHDPSSTAS